MLCFLKTPLTSIALLELMHLLLQCLLFLLQGAGIHVCAGGEASLTNSNVYENEAGTEWVSALHFESSQAVSSTALLENVTCTHGWQGGGGGLCIDGTATLINTNVYANKGEVCTFLEPSSGAGWNSRTLFLAGRRRRTLCAWHSSTD